MAIPNKKEKQVLKKIESTCMSNTDILHYFPDVKTISYNELSRYTSIDQLLPNNGSFVIILYQQSPNSCHWVALLRYNNMIEYFDSLGGIPDAPLKWNSSEVNQQLGITGPFLGRLLKKSGLPIIYNPMKYQEQNSEISTCGRHCTLRIQKMLEGFDLETYYKLLSMTKKKLKLPYDEIVAGLIRKC